ncbi:hypothetical protein F5Y16DRAFT_417648, partial [Xylariaceae sp. FL0255]
VLIQTDRCGWLNTFDITDYLTFYIAVSYLSGTINDAANYVQQCYSDTSRQFDCDIYAMKQIIGDVDMKAPCPFDDTICLTNTSIIRVDSGYINSHTHFGLNAPQEKQILWRNVIECAPLAQDGFISQDSQSATNDTLYHYGWMNSTHDGTMETIDYIFHAQDLLGQYKILGQGLTPESFFSIGVYTAIVVNGAHDEGNSEFLPIEELTRTDADLYLISLSGNGVLYSEPSNDLWYNISKTPIEESVMGIPLGDVDGYLPGAPASALACTDQYQYCSHGDPGSCGPLASFKDAVIGAAPMFNTIFGDVANNTADTEEGARFAYLVTGLDNAAETCQAVSTLGPSSLSSQRTLQGGFQGDVASNQWQIDGDELLGLLDISNPEHPALRRIEGSDVPTYPKHLDDGVGSTTDPDTPSRTVTKGSADAVFINDDAATVGHTSKWS